VPLSSVDRIEVVRGGGSALYGDHALGGVINIITKKGTSESALDLSVEGGSEGMNAVRLGASGTEGAMGYTVNAERYASDGYRDRTAFESTGGGAGINCDFSGGLNVSLDASMQSVDYEIPGWLSKTQMEQDPRQALNPDDRAENRYYNAGLGVTMEPAQGQRANVSLSFCRKDMENDMASWFSFADVVVDTIGLTPSYSLDMDLGGHRNNVLAGVDYYRDAMTADRYLDVARTTLTTTADVEKQTLGAYVRDEFSLDRSLALGLGGRVEAAKVDASVKSFGIPTVDDSVTHDESAWDLSLIRTFGGKSKVFARAGTVYRYPFVDEQVSYIGFGADRFYADIKPEEGESFEVGTEWVFGGECRGGLTLFLLNMRDEISWNGMTMRNENLDKTRHQGAEMSFACKPADFCRVEGNYTWTDAKFSAGMNDGNRIPLVPAHKASVGVKFFFPPRLTLDTVVRYVGESYLGSDYSNAGPKLDAYTVVDLYLQHESKAVKGLSVWAGAENILDEKYASLGYRGMFEDGYYPAPGTTFKGGVAYRF
jgi:iron complex outermembrane receptor protein